MSVFTLSSFRFISILFISALFITSCQNQQQEQIQEELSAKAIEQPLTADIRQTLQPEDVIQELIEGNSRFLSNELQGRDYNNELAVTSGGQSPYAVILSCIDSRVPVETVFDQRIGDIFSVRIAGNVINNDILGSMEFSCALAGAKLVVVMGHTKCGAIKGACNHVEHSHLTALLDKIQPVIESSKETFQGEHSNCNYEFIDYVAIENVKHIIEQIRLQSPNLAVLEQENKIKIVGCMYNITSGKVEFIEI